MIEQREIKFRAWDSGKMIYLKNTGYVMQTLFFTTQPWNDTGSCSEGYNIDSSDNIMQYTGLKDKNGVEIYDYDIVIVRWRDYTGWHEEIQVVENNNGYHFKNSGAHTMDQTIEVIGNIFQNPELIKE